MAFNIVEFYKNKEPATGLYLKEYHKWFGDYELLENNKYYFHRLFPQYNVTDEDRLAFKNDPKLMKRLLKSYDLVLDLFGFKIDKCTKELKKTKNWKDRFNYIITKKAYKKLSGFVKSLGLLDLHEQQLQFVIALIHEYKSNNIPNIETNLEDYMFPFLEKMARCKATYLLNHKCCHQIFEDIALAYGDSKLKHEKASYRALKYLKLV